VDDMLLGLDLAIAGYPPLHCHSGLIRGRLMKDKSAKSQKKRWVHGHIETIFTKTPLLLKLAITQKNFDLLWLAVELCIPPISLLIALWFASIVITSLGIIIDEFSFVPLGILVIEGIFIFLSLFMAWVKFAFNNISVKEILHIPYYFLWNILLHSSFIFKRQTYWSKTERD
jgi:hypothetical protein